MATVDLDHRDRGLRKQLTEANRPGAQYLLVIGEDEVSAACGKLKEMASGAEEMIDLTVDAVVARIQGA